ncbi:MAG: HepT-like ribonuclease domain-containing protein [Bulleidia sp.]|nr:HepT-like ribonuclease domain-containing protein [Bulleidia sp.]
MNSADKQRLQHIVQYCMDIAGFIDRFGDDQVAFSNDQAYKNAVSLSIMQIGELANGLSKEFRESTKEEMPWGPIRGMRNWIAHAYGEIDESIIWETAINDIPRLEEFCRRKLEESADI